MGTTWSGPSTAHALRLPTLLLGHARLGADWVCLIICLGMLQLWQAQSLAWACPIGHAQAGGWASPSTWAAVGLVHPLPNQRGHERGKPKSAQVQHESSPCKMLTGICPPHNQRTLQSRGSLTPAGELTLPKGRSQSARETPPVAPKSPKGSLISLRHTFIAMLDRLGEKRPYEVYFFHRAPIVLM